MHQNFQKMIPHKTPSNARSLQKKKTPPSSPYKSLLSQLQVSPTEPPNVADANLLESSKNIVPLSPKDASGGSTSDSEPDETTKRYLMKWGDKKYSPGKTNVNLPKTKHSTGAVKKLVVTSAEYTKVSKTKITLTSVSTQICKSIASSKYLQLSSANDTPVSSSYQTSKMTAKVTDAPIFIQRGDQQKSLLKSTSKKLTSPPLKVAASASKTKSNSNVNTIRSVDKNTSSMKSSQGASQKKNEKGPNFNLEALKLRLNKSKISSPKTILLSGPVSSSNATATDSGKVPTTVTTDSLDISTILTDIAKAPSLQKPKSVSTAGSLKSILSKTVTESSELGQSSTNDIDFNATPSNERGNKALPSSTGAVKESAAFEKGNKAAASSSGVVKESAAPAEPVVAKKTKLPLQQYNKKRRASNAQSDPGITLGFMKLPTISTSSTTSTTIEANTVDPTRVIVRHNSDKNKFKAATTTRPMRDFPRPSTDDVLGNILDSMSESIESDMARSKPKSRSSETITTDPIPPPPPPPLARPIQAILEQDSGSHSPAHSDDLMDNMELASVSSQGSDFDTDLDDYSGDEDGLLMFSDNNGNRQSHLELLNANQKTLSNAIVHAAILAGELSTVVEAYIPSNEIDELVDDNDTLLMKAVAECATDMVRVLLEKNADPNVMSRNGKTPLMYAVELNQKGIVVLLIQYGAQLNTQQSNGETALMIACKNGSIEILHCLLNNGADVIVKNMERTLASAPKYLRQSLGLALQKHSDKLNEIMQCVLREVLPIDDVSLGTSLMACRCVLPNERDEHDFYFSCNIDWTQPKVSVVLLCLPVTFEQAGSVNVKFGESDNGIDEIILNEQSMISIIPNNRYLYFLTPTKGVNELRIQTYNCGYKILVCINVVEYGSESLKRKAMYPGMPIMGSAMHPGQSGGVMMYRSVHR